ncbi:hypothetical protein [Kosakonia sp. 1610]|uniref:hypothetical protein n=1 Tax=Kosakonia sp. 1610 TaxID=3156426 RepID=UPI003D240FA7
MKKPTIEELEAQVKQLAAERDAVVAENAALKVAIPPLRMINDVTESWDDVSLAEEVGFNHAIHTIMKNIPETPATDAILASLRAEGVQIYAEKVLAENMMLAKKAGMETTSAVFAHLKHEAESFAAQLRSKSEVQND